MAGYCGCDPLARLCGRAKERRGGDEFLWLGPGFGPPPCRCRPERPSAPCHPMADCCACRQVCFWPCFCTDDLLEARRPRPCCQKCGCTDRLERQGRFVRCCACGWIGVFEECCVCCSLRSCCDNVLWPCRPGEPS